MSDDNGAGTAAATHTATSAWHYKRLYPTRGRAAAGPDAAGAEGGPVAAARAARAGRAGRKPGASSTGPGDWIESCRS